MMPPAVPNGAEALASACQRALVAGARMEGAGTRQQLRAAARRFVRRHRRDVHYLAFVLRSVAASSAFAVALLGLGAEPAHAKVTLFAAQTGAANPLDGQNAGWDATPALGDLDGDGDLDLVTGNLYGSLQYFENLGSAESPTFTAQTGAANPLDGQDVGDESTPALGDLDGDGDLDLVAGELDGSFFYFENTGTVTSPAFAQQTGTANPLDGQYVGPRSTPALGDLDGDGDLDLVVGVLGGTLQYLENTGSATSPAFLQQTGAANPFDGMGSNSPTSSYSRPALGDLDGDGDVDLIAGEYYQFFYLENTGSAASPAFTVQTGAANPLDGQEVSFRSRPAFGDLDGDGDFDLVTGESLGGTFLYFENLAGSMVSQFGTSAGPYPFPVFVSGRAAPAVGDLDDDGDLDMVAGDYFGLFGYFENTGSVTSPAFSLGAANPLDGQDVGDASTPALGDLDGDGDLDLVAGELAGRFFYFKNTGSVTSPAFVQQTGAANPLDGKDVGFRSTPALGDLDHDGDLDLFAGESNGTVLYFKNTGSATSPAFVQQTGAANPFDGQVVFLDSAPGLGDIDGDGDIDLVAGETVGPFVGALRYFENTGSVTSPAFTARTGAANPLEGEDVHRFPNPALGDIDGDGDVDLVAGDHYGLFVYFENAIVKPALSASERIGPANPLFGKDVGLHGAPALGDLDADGDLDLVAGEFNGSFLYFENTGGATIPIFTARTGAANPLDGQDVGYFPLPALGDLDGDGDLDLVAGEDNGTFLYFENVGSATSPAFVQQTGAANPLAGQDVGDNSAPALGDFDGDGDLDLVAGRYSTNLDYLENTGSATSPAFGGPIPSVVVGFTSAPSLGDIDGDGDLDMVAGEYYGSLRYFENTGSATIPAVWQFEERTGAANPFDGVDMGLNSTPALGDLNADGKLDLVVSERNGAFRTWYLPEPGRGLLLGAGVALLERLRRRRSSSR